MVNLFTIMFHQELIVSDAKNLYLALEPEKEDLIAKRARVTLDFKGNNLHITIDAEDFPSFRAMESAIMRLLVTFNKMKDIK